MTKNLNRGLLVAVMCVAASAATGADYDEALDGDLSNSKTAPTPVSVAEGANTISGTTVAANDPTGDPDFFTVTVPEGTELSALTLDSFSGDDIAFAGVVSGSDFDVNLSSATALLGWTHFSGANVGSDILPQMGTGGGAIGFTPPLPAGDYSFLIQETGTTVVSYSVTLQLSAVSSGGGAAIFSSVLPSSRSVQVGTTATFFATIVNGGSTDATDCSIAPSTGVDADFFYQETDPASNALVGSRDTPVDIAAGAFQTFLFAYSPNSAFGPSDLALSFDCADTDPAPVTTGLNTVLLSGTSTATPDVVALAATISGDGIVTANPSSVFSVASVNVGADGIIEVSADTGSVSLPVDIALCETDPGTGACINPTSPSTNPVSTTILSGDTPTFGVFVTATGDIAFDPGVNRIFVRFADGGGVTRGSTSVAVRTP